MDDTTECKDPNHVVVVGGGTGVVGRAVLSLLQAETKWKILVPYRHAPRHPLPDGVTGIPFSPTDPASCEALTAQVEMLGTWKTCISCVGAFAMGRAISTPPDVLAALLESNLTTPWMLAEIAAKNMIKTQTSGSIAIVLSAAATHIAQGQAAYQVSKAAALRMTEVLSMELARDHIRVNGLLPGVIDTPANRTDMPDADFALWTKPSAVARLLLWLATSDSIDVSGAMFPIT